MRTKMEAVMMKAVSLALALVLGVGLVAPNVMMVQAAERFVVADYSDGYRVTFDRAPINVVPDPAWTDNYFAEFTVTLGTTMSVEAFDDYHRWVIDGDMEVFPVSRRVVTGNITTGGQRTGPNVGGPGVLNNNVRRFTFNEPGFFFVSIAGEAMVVFYVNVVGETSTTTPQTSEQTPTQQPQTVVGDLTISPWAQVAVGEAIAAGIVPQNLQSNYSQATTRAEFATLATALYETVTGATITGRANFNDTNDINVQKMGYLGVVTGVGGGNFNPNGQLTREQAAVMLARLAEAMGRRITPTNLTFADNAQIATWAREAVGQMQSAGIMSGVGNNQFAPQGDYTREQSIVTIMRLYDFVNANPATITQASTTSRMGAEFEELGLGDAFIDDLIASFSDESFLSFLDAMFDEMFASMDDGQNFTEVSINLNEVFQPTAFDENGRPRRLVIDESGAAFHRWLTDFTLDLVAGIPSREAQLEHIYDFIIRNFTYWDERDGHVIDGSRRPPAAQVPPAPLTIMNMSTPELAMARELMATGQGVCDHFAALFAFMAQAIGYDEVRIPGGFYINRNGTRVGHAWTAIAINGEWFFFDPQIEASNLKSNRNNAGWNPRHWWMQPVNAELTQSRYETRNDYRWN